MRVIYPGGSTGTREPPQSSFSRAGRHVDRSSVQARHTYGYHARLVVAEVESVRKPTFQVASEKTGEGAGERCPDRPTYEIHIKKDFGSLRVLALA